MSRERVGTAPEHGPTQPCSTSETVELALLTAIQHLSPLQHAAFVMRDVLNLSAEETATALSTTLPATNSALQRARRGPRARLAPNRIDWPSTTPSPPIGTRCAAT